MLIEAKVQLDKFYAEYNEKKAHGIKKSKEWETQTIAALSNTNINVWVNFSSVLGICIEANRSPP